MTPNLPEAEALTGIYPRSEHRLRNAAMVFKMLGNEAVLFKGGHGEGDQVRDVLWADGEFIAFEAPRQDTPPHPWHRLHPGHRHRLRPGAETHLAGCGRPRPYLCAAGDQDRAGAGPGSWAAEPFLHRWP